MTTDPDISLATCPGCGEEIRWEQPRLRVSPAHGGVPVVWHTDCHITQSHAPGRTQRPHHGSSVQEILESIFKLYRGCR